MKIAKSIKNSILNKCKESKIKCKESKQVNKVN